MIKGIIEKALRANKISFRHLKEDDLSTNKPVSRSSCPEVFLNISQNSQKNICARASFLIKLQAPSAMQEEKQIQ